MYSLKIPVRYYEADPMGVVHHSEYIRYFELARDTWMSEAGYSIADAAADNVVFPVTHIDLDYKYSARFGDTVTVTLELESFTGARVTFHQTVLNADGHVCADGHVVLGFLNSETGRIMRCPEKIAALIESISK